MIEVFKVLCIAFAAFFGVVLFTLLWDLIIEGLLIGIGRLICWVQQMRG